MQHGKFQKKKNLLTPHQGSMVCVRGKYLLACYCMLYSLYFDTQHDHILKMIFVRPTGVYLLDFFCSGIHSVLITVSINFISFVQYIYSYKAKQ